MDEDVREVRVRCTRHLAELHRLHLTLLGEARWLKRFTAEGRASAEIEIVAELMEQYLSASDAFLENMRGRMEARLGLLRRGRAAGERSRRRGARPWQLLAELFPSLRRAAARGRALGKLMRPTACLKFALPDGHPQRTLGNRGLYYSVSGTGRVIHCVSEI